jgi:drug/metabolite transporter (DMT)-like permease
LFISTSGVLGRWITLPPEVSIFWRSLIAIPLLIVILKLGKQSLGAVFQWEPKLILAGLFMGTHWVTYFYALQWSNVAIGMLSLFTYPVITAFLEPLFFKTRFEKRHLFVGGLTLSGIYFLVPSFALAQTHGWALATGIFSAFCYAMRNLLLKGAAQEQSGLQLMLFQVVIIALCFLPFMSFEKFEMSIPFWWALLFLALFTTVIGHSLFLYSLKYFTVTTASLMSSINPLYGILIAYLFLNEIPHWGVYIGGILIIFAVLFENKFSR